MVSAIAPETDNDKDILEVVKDFDANKDNKIDKTEYEHLKKFVDSDTNGNDTLRNEFKNDVENLDDLVDEIEKIEMIQSIVKKQTIAQLGGGANKHLRRRSSQASHNSDSATSNQSRTL